MSDETVLVSVMRKRRDGRVLPVRPMELARVPCVGEFIGDRGTDHDEDNQPCYRVTNVLHLPSRGGAEFLAEVWAVEAEREPSFE